MNNKRISNIKDEEYHSDDDDKRVFLHSGRNRSKSPALLRLPTNDEMSEIRCRGRVSRPDQISLPSPLHILTEQRVTGVAEAKSIQFVTRIMLTTKKLSLEDREVLYEEMVDACGKNIGTSRSSIDLNNEEKEEEEEDYCSRIFYSDKGVLIETIQTVRKVGNGKVTTMTSEEKTYSDICKTKIIGDKGKFINGSLNIKCKETINSKDQTYTRSEKFLIGLKNNQTGRNYEINSEKKTFDPTNTVKLNENIWFDAENITILIDHTATADMTQYWRHEKGTFGEQLCDYKDIEFVFGARSEEPSTSSKLSTTPSSSYSSTPSSQSPSKSSSGCSLRSILAKAKLTPRNVATPKKEIDSIKASETLTLAELVEKMKTPNKQDTTSSTVSSNPSPMQKSAMKRKIPVKTTPNKQSTTATPTSTNSLRSEDAVKMSPKRKLSELVQKMRNGPTPVKRTPIKQDMTRSSNSSASSRSGASTEKKRPKKARSLNNTTPNKLLKIVSPQPIVLNDGRPGQKKEYTENVDIVMIVNGYPYKIELGMTFVAAKKPQTELGSVSFKGETVWEAGRSRNNSTFQNDDRAKKIKPEL